MSARFAEARPHLEYGVRRYDPQLHRPLTFVMWHDVGVVAHTWLSWSLWFLGYPDQALLHSREALALAQASEHGLTLSYAHYAAGCLLHLFGRGTATAREQLAATMAPTAEQGLSLFEAGVIVLDGWLRVEEGRIEAGIARMHEGLAAWQATGARSLTPYYHALLAEAHRRAGRAEQALAALEQGLEVVACTGERFWEAELHRLRGLWLAEQEAAEAEGSLRRALAVAQGQQAKMLELRAAVNLARPLQAWGRGEEAHTLLAGVYGWFTEGFDTPDLQEARALLEELAAGR